MTATLKSKKKNKQKKAQASLIYIFFFLQFFITKCKKYFMFVLNILQFLYIVYQVKQEIKQKHKEGRAVTYFLSLRRNCTRHDCV